MSIYDVNAPQPPNVQAFSSLDDHIDRLFRFELHLIEPRETSEIKARLDALLPKGVTASVTRGKLRRKVITIVTTGPCVDHLLDAGTPVNKHDTGPRCHDARRRERDRLDDSQTDVFMEDIAQFCLQACE